MSETLTCSIGTLQYASYKGVSFWVSADEASFGRRYAHHEFAKGDIPSNENMGRKQRKYSVTGYLVGDDAQSQKDTLKVICEEEGGGLLILPAEDPGVVVCDECTITRNKDDQGIFNAKMTFFEEPLFGGLTVLGSAIEGLIGGVFSASVGPIGLYFDATFDVDDTQAYVIDNVVTRARSFAQVMTTGVETFGVADQRPITKAMTDLISLYQNAATLARPQQDTDLSLADVVSNIFSNVLNVKDPSVAVPLMMDMAAFSVAENDTLSAYQSGQQVIVYTGDTLTTVDAAKVLYAPSEIADANNAAAFNGMVRSYALIGLAKGIAATVFTDRQSAIQARANLVDLMQRQMERVDDYDVTLALIKARDYCVRALSEQIVSIVPLVHVTGPTLPSLYWAGRLYDDATRALELSDRNNVRTSAFMPQEFDALFS